MEDLHAFGEALLCMEKSSLIPEDQDFWGKEPGTWEVEWSSGGETLHGQMRAFRVLEGLGIQELYRFGNRDATVLRLYNPERGAWDAMRAHP